MTLLGSPAGCDACPTRDDLEAELHEAYERIAELEYDVACHERGIWLDDDEAPHYSPGYYDWGTGEWHE